MHDILAISFCPLVFGKEESRSNAFACARVSQISISPLARGLS
jgi:hypothetical protein